MPSRFSILAAALSDDPRIAVRTARGDGFDGILFDANSASLDLTALSQSGRREFRQMVSSSNIALVGLRVELGPKGLGPGANVDRALEQLDRIMETGAGLGAPLLCLDLGPLPPAPAQALPLAPEPTPEMAGLIILPQTEARVPPAAVELTVEERAFASQLNAVLPELCARADRYNCIVAARSDLADFASLDYALRGANCPWLGIDLDPIAILRDRWNKDEIFSRLAPLIRHVRVRDALVGADRRTRAAPVGEGSVNWEELLSDLEAAGYPGWLSIDPLELPDRRSAALAALAHLKAVVAKQDAPRKRGG